MRSKTHTSAYFYTLVSTDTVEMYYSSKRQQFLVDQGYTFKVVDEFKGLLFLTVVDEKDLVYSTITSQIELLNIVLMSSIDLEKDDEADEIQSSEDEDTEQRVVRTSASTLGSLAGADSMAYMQVSTSSSFAKEVVKKRRRA